MSLVIDVANLQQIGHATYVLHNENIKVGRDDDNNLVIHEAHVSRHHAILTPVDATVAISDLNSRNGTFLFAKHQWIKINNTHHIQLPILIMLGSSTILRIRHHDPDSAITSEGESNNPITAGPMDLKRKKTCSIMVLDMCNSSDIANADEKMAYYLKLRLNQISFPILYVHNVDFVKGTGDGFLATFVHSHDALRAGIELAALIQTRNHTTKNLPIAYRIALHYGLVIPTNDTGLDVHGNDINITFRVEGIKSEQFFQLECQLSKTNRILCTNQFLHSISSNTFSNVIEFNRCGIAKVKGIVEEIELFLVTNVKNKSA